jgi:hypothetical protein
MNKGIITEVHRIKEIMGISTEKILSESIGGLLDDIIGLLKTGSKLPPDVEEELIDLLKQNGRNENDLPVFLEKYKNTTKEQDKNTIIQAYFGKSRSEINSAVTAAIRILDPVVQGAVYSKLILGSQNADAWKAIEYLRNMVEGGKELNETLAKQIDQQLKYWDQVKSNYLSSNPANRELESQIFLIDNRYKELRSELDTYKMNAKSFSKDPITGNKFFENVLSNETPEGQAQAIWNRFSKSENPDEKKIFEELQKKYNNEDQWINYVKSQFEDSAKLEEMYTKIKTDIALSFKGNRSKIQRILDSICGTKIRISSDTKSSTMGVAGFGIKKTETTYKGGDLIEEMNWVCTTIKKITNVSIWMAILPSLGALIAGVIVYYKDRVVSTVEKISYQLGSCLEDEKMTEWINDPKFSPLNEQGNWAYYESTMCSSKQIKYKKMEQVGEDGNWEWDGKTYVRLSIDNDDEFKGVAILTDDIKNIVLDTSANVDTTTQNVVNKLDSAAQSLGINTGNGAQTSEPAPTQNNTNFRNRRKKQ